ncbi:hypothetical protein ACN47E_007371 [Coniothyrium glycines]
MIPRIVFSALLCAPTAVAVCTKLENCPQYEHLKTSECQTYHHFLARGSTSPYPGHVIETVGKVCNALNTEGNANACGYEDIEYWAMNGGERWCISSHEGAINGAEQMRNYTARCPDSHLILMGFSQGGSVALDIVGGGGGELWGCNQEENPNMNITNAPGSKIAAVLAFGPTRRSANQTWTYAGGEVSDGAAPRTAEQNAGLKAYADSGLLREYCQPGDPICAPHTPNTDMSKHLDYFDKYGDEASAWVIERVRAASGDSQTSGASSKLQQTISHPIASVVLLIFAVFSVYFITRKILVWKTTSSYTRVNGDETV